MAVLFHPNKNGDNTPETLKAETGKKLWWICKNGHKWQQTGDQLSRNDTAQLCRKCRSLAAVRPDIAAMWHPEINEGSSPINVDFSSGLKRWWQCTVDKDHVCEALPNNMVAPSRKRFCPYCR